MNATQTQVGGSHYKDMAIQPIEFTLKNGLGFCEGNVIKYVSRHKSKGGRADLEKAIHYLQLLIEQEYPDPKPETLEAVRVEFERAGIPILEGAR